MKTIIIFCCSLFALTVAQQAPALKCQNKPVTIPAEVMKAMPACEQKIYGAGFEKNLVLNQNPTQAQVQKVMEWAQKNIVPKNGCIVVCQAKSLKLVNDDGKFNKENFTKLSEKVLTKDTTTKIVTGAEKCIKDNPNVLFKEDTCMKSAQQIEKLRACIELVIKKACGF